MKTRFSFTQIVCLLILGLVGCSKPADTESREYFQMYSGTLEIPSSTQKVDLINSITTVSTIQSGLPVPRYFECDSEVDQNQDIITQLDTLSDLPNNEEKREEWLDLIGQYVKLADLGSCEAFYKLGEIYYYYFDYKKQDLASKVKFMHTTNARPYFEVGAVLGNHYSELHLGFIFMEKACDNSTVKDHLQCLKKLTRQKNYFKRAYEGFKKDGSDSKSESDALSYINIAIEDIQTIKQSLKNSGEIWLNDYIANNVVRDAEVDYEAIYYSLIEEDYSTDAEQYALLKQAEHALAMLIQAGSEDELSYQKLQEKKAEMAEDLYQELIGSALRLEDAYPMTATCDLIAGVSPAIKAERSRLAQDMKSLIDQLNKAPAILTNQDFRYRRYELVKGYKALANQDDCYAFYNLSLIQQFLGNAKSTPTNIQKDPRFAFAFARVAAQAGLAEASWLMSNHAYSMLRDDMSAENKTHTLERAIRWLNRAEKQMDPNNDADKARLLEWKNKLNGMLQQISENVSH